MLIEKSMDFIKENWTTLCFIAIIIFSNCKNFLEQKSLKKLDFSSIPSILQTINNKLENINNKLKDIDNTINEIDKTQALLKTESQGLKSEGLELITDIRALKLDIHVLKIDIRGLKIDVHGLKLDIIGLRIAIQKLNKILIASNLASPDILHTKTENTKVEDQKTNIDANINSNTGINL